MIDTPMRFLHMINLRNVGGVERMFAEFIVAPPPFPVEHHIIGEHPEIAEALKETILRNARFVSVRRWGVPPKKPRWFWQWRYRHLIKNIRPDRIVVWNQFLDFDFPVDCPIIYYEHGGAWYPQNPEVACRFFSQIDAAVAVSYAAQRMLVLKYQVSQKIHIKRNRLLDYARPSMPVSSRAGFAKPRSVQIGSAGRLAPVKCMGLIVLAVKRLRERGIDASATIAGEGRERPILEALIAEYRLQSNVRLIGLQEDMSGFYRNIDIYVCASMRESFGLSCIEAAAWGVPVITGNVDGMVESVQHGITGICLEPTLDQKTYLEKTHATPDFPLLIYWPLSDTIAPPKMLAPETIAEAIIGLLDQPERYRELSRQALTMAQAQESFSDLCGDLYRIFKAPTD
ncbi:MAG: glycosyltransferase family 4 protein [Burkholderiales bacterium]|nr:glycosyltransferase family 4 protein [Burkholderiales bacterium]